jgi:twitching motility protein PilT
MHTATAAETVERLVAVHPPAQQEQVRRQLAGVLRAVISQQLVPRADGKGRVPVAEIMLVVPEIARLIAEGRYAEIEAEIEKHRGEDGMTTMVQALRDHVDRGAITQRAAASVKLGAGRVAGV